MRILIDLSILKNVHCGLGQVALNYGYFFRDSYIPQPNEKFYISLFHNYIDFDEFCKNNFQKIIYY